MKRIPLFLCFLLIYISPALAQHKSAAKKIEESFKADPDSAKVDTISPKQLATSGFADIIEDLLPTVVNISATQEIQANSNANLDQILFGEVPKSPLLDDFRNQLENQFRNQQNHKKKISSIGSGFIISKDGYIVTNSHVIDEADEILVSLNDGQKYKAKTIGIDKKTDLALLKINAEKDLKFAKFGDSNKARIGDWVIVIGNPYGLGGSVSVGIVSARGRDINNGQSEDFIQTDAAINKGNSGGPLFNSKGEVIGISTAIFSPSGGNVGIGFATPSASAIQVVKQLKEQGEVIRGWLGVSVQDVSEELAESIKMDKPRGAFVTDVTKGGPADNAGILPTDVIIKFDDQEITEMKILPKTVARFPVGKSAKVTVFRGGKIKVLNVRVGKMPEEEKKAVVKTVEKKVLIKSNSTLLGLGVAELSEKIKRGHNIRSEIKGLLVTDINPKSEAAEKGIMINDIILSANQTPLVSIDDFKQVIEEAKKSTSKKIFLFLRRGETNYSMVLTVK